MTSHIMIINIKILKHVPSYVFCNVHSSWFWFPPSFHHPYWKTGSWCLVRTWSRLTSLSFR